MIDLLSVANGGVEVACSNRHYGEPKNMIKVLLSAIAFEGYMLVV